MKKFLGAFCALACSAAMLAGGMTVSAESEYKVYDYGDLLSESEETALEEKLFSIASMYDHDIIIYTTDSMDGMDAEEYTEYLKDSLNAGIDGSGIIYMVSMEYRDYDIYSFGRMYNEIMIQSITDDMAEELQPYLSDGRYYDAFDKYADKVLFEIQYVEENGPNEEPSFAIPIGIGCGLLIGLITVLVMKGNMKTTRAESMANNYIRQGSFKLTNSRDIFLYSQVTRTKRSSDSSSGGGGHSSGKF
ncbi:MAG: TPM domain-containing protein [Huintestinicola sp.]|uniref:TPM domain-containing protein n=1 Tax=Huintestinicola sp. TaxID=2981661 RepID=UPI003F02596A